MQSTKPSVAVCVPVFNKIKLTLRFLESFASVKYTNYRMIIIDDGSKDGTKEILADQHPDVVVLQGDGNLWWTGGTNKGVEYALENNFDYVLTINNDCRVDPDFLTYLVETAERTPKSIVGNRLNILQDPSKVWALGGYMNWRRGKIFQLLEHNQEDADVCKRHPAPLPVSILTGCGTLVPTKCFREIGLYDQRWFPQYHADSEIILRAKKKGYQAYCEPRAVVWNDIQSTANITNRRDAIFSKRSPFYWRPIVAAHIKYCPLPYIPYSLARQYLWLMPRPRRVHIQQAKYKLKREAKRVAGLFLGLFRIRKRKPSNLAINSQPAINDFQSSPVESNPATPQADFKKSAA